VKGLGKRGKTGDGTGQPNCLAEPHGREKRKDITCTLGDYAGDKRSDARTRSAGAHEQRAGKNEQGGQRHLQSSLCE
jgi:hypothetical protein